MKRVTSLTRCAHGVRMTDDCTLCDQATDGPCINCGEDIPRDRGTPEGTIRFACDECWR